MAFPIINDNKTRIHAEWTKIKIKKGIINHKDLVKDSVKSDLILKYGRVNTLKISIEEIIQILIKNGFVHKSMDSFNDEQT